MDLSELFTMEGSLLDKGVCRQLVHDFNHAATSDTAFVPHPNPSAGARFLIGDQSAVLGVVPLVMQESE